MCVQQSYQYCSARPTFVLSNTTLELPAGGFLLQQIELSTWASRKEPIKAWSISVKAFNSSCSAPRKFNPLFGPICLSYLSDVSLSSKKPSLKCLNEKIFLQIVSHSQLHCPASKPCKHSLCDALCHCKWTKALNRLLLQMVETYQLRNIQKCSNLSFGRSAITWYPILPLPQNCHILRRLCQVSYLFHLCFI